MSGHSPYCDVLCDCPDTPPEKDVLTIAEEIRECCERLSFRSSCARDYLGYVNATAAAHEGAHLLAFATEIAEARRQREQTCETCKFSEGKPATWCTKSWHPGGGKDERVICYLMCATFGNRCGAWEAR